VLAAVPDGALPIVHRGADALYLAVPGDLGDLTTRSVGVLSRSAVAVPCGLRTMLDRLPEVAAAEVRGGELHLDGRAVRIGRLVDAAVPSLARRVREGPAAPPGDIAAMVGRGDGLTPYDDDVLCGWLALHRAAGVPTPAVDAAVVAALHRTTLLSATLLDCALHGEVIPQFAAWVSAIDTDAEPARAADLAAVGHSSGRGMLHGARLALHDLSITQPRQEGVAA